MTGSEVRQKFLDYFSARGHRVVRSSSLVPANDPTLLFTNAGMNQFKDVFLGQEQRDYSRAASSQKCVRAGGKHNDLDNVGYTRRHHTFFEMLGNFSFGDYFKKDAIAYAWELITKEYGLPKDKLYVTVFREDDDAEELWQKVAGVPRERIFRLGEKDNFWQMGETGPCGPCSEIHYDFGPEAGAGSFPDDPGERFVEIWNLVFMQYDRDSHGTFNPLPRPSIDTGMGLERIAAVKQGVLSNYDTDLIKPIVLEAGELIGRVFGDDPAIDTAMRINADHARATAFLIHDGVLPSNEGRGYVLRKIMRRAMRNGRMAGATDPYLYKLTGFVAEHMRDAYPEMMESVGRVARVVKDEEHRYATTFQVAERIFQDEAKAAAGGVLPGPAAFKLYDTYGLALDEQEDMAREFGLSIDREGFTAEMEKQRTRARASWKGAEKAQVRPEYQSLPETEFVGRETLETPVKVLKVLDTYRSTEPIFPTTPYKGVELVFDRTPFYAEAGGQVGDKGQLFSLAGDEVAVIEDTYKPTSNAVVHKTLPKALIKEGDVLKAKVNLTLRDATKRNHTATHLLHAALRKVLGTHVKQAGSVVDPERLRFDFTHYTAMDADEVSAVELLVNAEIIRNQDVKTEVMDLDNALSTGAMALFGEKYGDKVRVVSIDPFSTELCGGTHVAHTGNIGSFKIVHEGSIAAGVRRIEAITGLTAWEWGRDTQRKIDRAVALAQSSEWLGQFERHLATEKSLEHEVQQLKTKMAQAQASGLESQARTFGTTKVLAAQVLGLDRPQLRVMVDSFRNKWPEAVIVLGTATSDDSVSIVAGVTKGLTGKVNAGKLVNSVAQAVGGKGGGRPDMAEAGGNNPEALDGALERVYFDVEGML